MTEMVRRTGPEERLSADVAAYVRVSSRTQSDITQRDAIQRAATGRGDVIGAWYGERRSGSTLARPELVRLRNDARAGAIRRLYLFRLDRLTRSGIRDTFEVLEGLRAHGVDVISIADGFDLNGPAADVVLAVMAWAARMELQARAERIAAARERIEAEGGAWGRPRRLDRRDVVRAEEMRTAGRSIRAISMALKVPRSTVADALRRASGKPPAPTASNSPSGGTRRGGRT